MLNALSLHQGGLLFIVSFLLNKLFDSSKLFSTNNLLRENKKGIYHKLDSRNYLVVNELLETKKYEL
jgi:hypothetical protein